jgi:hypothetical protein
MPDAPTGSKTKEQQQREDDFQAGRPYRSHKLPACERCRRRKVRCTMDVPGQGCLLCRLQSARCKKVDEPGGTGDSNIDGRPPKRPRPDPQLPSESQQITDPASPSILFQPCGAHRTAPGDDQERHATIVGPVAAEDIHIIEKYLISQRVPQASKKTSSYNVVSNDPSRPVLYQSIPARTKSLNTEAPSGSSQRVIFEQILGPLTQPLISVYFRRLLICLSEQKLI